MSRSEPTPIRSIKGILATHCPLSPAPEKFTFTAWCPIVFTLGPFFSALVVLEGGREEGEVEGSGVLAQACSDRRVNAGSPFFSPTTTTAANRSPFRPVAHTCVSARFFCTGPAGGDVTSRSRDSGEQCR